MLGVNRYIKKENSNLALQNWTKLLTNWNSAVSEVLWEKVRLLLSTWLSQLKSQECLDSPTQKLYPPHIGFKFSAKQIKVLIFLHEQKDIAAHEFRFGFNFISQHISFLDRPFIHLFIFTIQHISFLDRSFIHLS